MDVDVKALIMIQSSSFLLTQWGTLDREKSRPVHFFTDYACIQEQLELL